MHVKYLGSRAEYIFRALAWLRAAASCSLQLIMVHMKPATLRQILDEIPENTVSLDTYSNPVEAKRPLLQCKRLRDLFADMHADDLTHLPLKTLELRGNVPIALPESLQTLRIQSPDTPINIQRLSSMHLPRLNFLNATCISLKNIHQSFPQLTCLISEYATVDSEGLRAHQSLRSMRVNTLIGNELPPALETLVVTTALSLSHDALPPTLQSLTCTAALSRFSLPRLRQLVLFVDDFVIPQFDLPMLEFLELKYIMADSDHWPWFEKVVLLELLSIYFLPPQEASRVLTVSTLLSAAQRLQGQRPQIPKNR